MAVNSAGPTSDSQAICWRSRLPDRPRSASERRHRGHPDRRWVRAGVWHQARSAVHAGDVSSQAQSAREKGVSQLSARRWCRRVESGAQASHAGDSSSTGRSASERRHRRLIRSALGVGGVHRAPGVHAAIARQASRRARRGHHGASGGAGWAAWIQCAQAANAGDLPSSTGPDRPARRCHRWHRHGSG